MMTLVLDRTFQPLRLRHWQREIADVLLGKLRVVRNYETATIRSVRFEMPVPAVVVSHGEKTHGKQIKFSRENIWLRDKGKCQYCSHKISRREMTYDHVTPRALGGTTTWTNVVTCCVPCNKTKGGRTPAEAGMHLLREPERPDWLPKAGWTWVSDKNVPSELRQILRDMQYWNLELDAK